MTKLEHTHLISYSYLPCLITYAFLSSHLKVLSFLIASFCSALLSLFPLLLHVNFNHNQNYLVSYNTLVTPHHPCLNTLVSFSPNPQWLHEK